MNNLLIFFAFPIAIITFSIVLQKILHSPFAVSSLIFSIFLIVTFAAFDETFLIATLVYTIIAFLTALITQILFNNSFNQNTNSITQLCNKLEKEFENKNYKKDTTNENKTCDTTDTITGILDDDNTINNTNSYGCMYNRRCRRF